MQRIYTREMTETAKKIFTKKNENLLMKVFAKNFSKKRIFPPKRRKRKLCKNLSEELKIPISASDHH